MILRLLRGQASAADAAAFAARLRDDVLPASAGREDPAAYVVGVRDEGGRLGYLAVSTWHSIEAVATVDGLAGPSSLFRAVEGVVAFATPEHLELSEPEGDPIGFVANGTVGIVRAVVPFEREAAALELVRRQRSTLLASGDVHGLLLGRRLQEDAVELVAVALWRDRDRMRTYLAERPEGPGIDPRFTDLASHFTFETFEVFDPARPDAVVGVPAVLVVDGERVIVDASTGVEALLGVPAELLLQRRLDDIVTIAARERLEERWATHLRDGREEALVDSGSVLGGPRLLLHRSVANVPAPGLHSILLQPLGASPSDDVEATIRSALGDWLALRGPMPRSGGTLPRLVTAPSTDRLFGRFAEHALEALGSPSMRRLQLHLRGLYPQAVVHPRQLGGEVHPVWYVFRDGRVRPPALPKAWWRGGNVGSIAVDVDGRIVEVDERAAVLGGRPLPGLVGADARTFGVPGSSDDLALLLRLALEEGAVDSTIRVVSARGEPVDLAVHGERDGALLRCRIARLPPLDGAREWFAPISLPSWDDAFVARVEDLCARLAPRDALSFAAELAARLRVRYPGVVVTPLGHPIGFGARTQVLLVYRDGERSPYAEDAWWEDPDAAWLTMRDGRVVEASAGAAALFGLSPAELLASTTGRLLQRREDTPWLVDILRRTGTLHTTTRIVRADGRPAELEYRAVADRDPKGPVRITLRLVEPLSADPGGGSPAALASG
ncbi:MAG TPA: PAS domain-containing protein [Candidatus Limnocylindrales bacterium]